MRTGTAPPAAEAATVQMNIEESRSLWIGTKDFANWLKIHPQTVRAIKKMELGPWKQGLHYRHTGLTGRGPIQWNRDLAEQAFTEFKRTPAEKVETFSRVPNPVVR